MKFVRTILDNNHLWAVKEEGKRIEPNVYIVTGGAIKLMATMQEREHTRKELDKLNACRDFLKQNGVFYQESFINSFE